MEDLGAQPVVALTGRPRHGPLLGGGQAGEDDRLRLCACPRRVGQQPRQLVRLRLRDPVVRRGQLLDGRADLGGQVRQHPRHQFGVATQVIGQQFFRGGVTAGRGGGEDANRAYRIAPHGLAQRSPHMGIPGALQHQPERLVAGQPAQDLEQPFAAPGFVVVLVERLGQIRGYRGPHTVGQGDEVFDVIAVGDRDMRRGAQDLEVFGRSQGTQQPFPRHRVHGCGAAFGHPLQLGRHEIGAERLPGRRRAQLGQEIDGVLVVGVGRHGEQCAQPFGGVLDVRAGCGVPHQAAFAGAVRADPDVAAFDEGTDGEAQAMGNDPGVHEPHGHRAAVDGRLRDGRDDRRTQRARLAGPVLPCRRDQCRVRIAVRERLLDLIGVLGAQIHFAQIGHLYLPAGQAAAPGMHMPLPGTRHVDGVFVGR